MMRQAAVAGPPGYQATHKLDDMYEQRFGDTSTKTPSPDKRSSGLGTGKGSHKGKVERNMSLNPLQLLRFKYLDYLSP